MNFQVLLSLATLISCVCLTHGCICPAIDKKTAYCIADFGLRGKPYEVYGAMYIDGVLHRKFCILDLYLFRGYITDDCVFTPDNVCGVPFIGGKEYLVSGYIRNGLMIVNVCGWNERWNTIDYHIRRLLYHPRFCDIPTPPITKTPQPKLY